ncbi:MAG: amidohydrolase family protein [Victivallales bacterium]|nr:amidohydrolase family protein [Victivallales bacterium]
MQKLTGNIVTTEATFYGCLTWNDEGIITAVERLGEFLPGADWILAGFIDLHLHGLGPYSAETEEGMRGMAAFAPTVGTTILCPTLSCAPEEMMLDQLRIIARLVKQGTPGARIAGTHSEGPWLNPIYKGGMIHEYIRTATLREAQAFLEAADGTLKLLTLAPEMPGALEVVRFLVSQGVAVSAGHTGLPTWFYEEAIQAGVSQFCHLFDAYACPVSHEGVRQPALTDLAIIDDRVMKELIVDGMHVPPELVQLVRRGADADHIVAITDAMQGAGLKEGHFVDYGVPYTIREGELARRDSDGAIIGSSLSMNLAFRNLTQRFGFTPSEATKLLSANQAKILGFAEKTGRLAVGLWADIAVLANDSKTVKACFVKGKGTVSC